MVTDFLIACDRSPQALAPALRDFLDARWKMPVPADVWDDAAPPAHLLVNVRVVDAAGKELGAGRDVRALKNQFGEAAQLTFSASDPGIERTGLKSWDCGDLPASLSFIRDGHG